MKNTVFSLLLSSLLILLLSCANTSELSKIQNYVPSAMFRIYKVDGIEVPNVPYLFVKPGRHTLILIRKSITEWRKLKGGKEDEHPTVVGNFEPGKVYKVIILNGYPVVVEM